VEKGPFVQQEQPKGGSQRSDVHRLHVHVLERALGTHAQGVFAHQACMTITSTSIPSLVTRNVSSRLSNCTSDPMEAIRHVSRPNASLVPLPRSFLLREEDHDPINFVTPPFTCLRHVRLFVLKPQSFPPSPRSLCLLLLQLHSPRYHAPPLHPTCSRTDTPTSSPTNSSSVFSSSPPIPAPSPTQALLALLRHGIELFGSRHSRRSLPQTHVPTVSKPLQRPSPRTKKLET
jgi:hypothetical protein